MPKKCLDAALDEVRSPIRPKKTDDKMTIAATITNTTSATNYTSDSNFKLLTRNSHLAKCVKKLTVNITQNEDLAKLCMKMKAV